ncbi:MAG TPA: hypothetical protein VKA15_00225 [Isosphaeraceae bacterium]|nr:hypothetical protein [Isosphaeraceae bacterium]
MVEATGQRRFHLSIRTLMIAVALCALLLAPLVWVLRRTELQLTMERLAAENASAQAERAVAQARSARAVFTATTAAATDQPTAESLWAALSVNHPVFKAGQTKDLRIEFTLVNDGEEVIDPKIPESRIVINSKELGESELVVSSVLKDARFKALSPGDSLQFSVALGDEFKEPGTYRVSWNGAGFQSAEIVVRILPDKAR